MMYLSKGGAGADSAHTWIRPCLFRSVSHKFSKLLGDPTCPLTSPLPLDVSSFWSIKIYTIQYIDSGGEKITTINHMTRIYYINAAEYRWVYFSIFPG